jgi:hypothetical protein
MLPWPPLAAAVAVAEVPRVRLARAGQVTFDAARAAILMTRAYNRGPLSRLLLECFGYDGRPPTTKEREKLVAAGYLTSLDGRLTKEGAAERRRLQREESP